MFRAVNLTIPKDVLAKYKILSFVRFCIHNNTSYEKSPAIQLVEYALPLNCAYMKKAHLAEMGFIISFEKDLALEVRHRRTITSTESACKVMKHF